MRHPQACDIKEKSEGENSTVLSVSSVFMDDVESPHRQAL